MREGKGDKKSKAPRLWEIKIGDQGAVGFRAPLTEERKWVRFPVEKDRWEATTSSSMSQTQHARKYKKHAKGEGEKERITTGKPCVHAKSGERRSRESACTPMWARLDLDLDLDLGSIYGCLDVMLVLLLHLLLRNY